jgi:hypothetical protein
MKRASFLHSAVYLGLLVVWLVPGVRGPTVVLGFTHGIGWIVMSLAAVVAVRLRVISLRLGVAIAVIGGIGPFVGSYEFVREERGRSVGRGSA